MHECEESILLGSQFFPKLSRIQHNPNQRPSRFFYKNLQKDFDSSDGNAKDTEQSQFKKRRKLSD